MGLFVEGININIREIQVSDAEFILALRTDPQYSRYLGKTKNDIKEQKKYIEYNLQKDDDIYFIVEDKTGKRYGCARLYNITNRQFTYGSWIIIKEAPVSFGIEVYFLVSDFAYFHLKLEMAEFDVRKDNKSVTDFHKKMNAKIFNDDEHCFYFRQTKQQYELVREKYKRYTLKRVSDFVKND